MKEKVSGRFIIYLLLALVLVQIPFAGDYIRLINTMIHETGHAFMALLGGHVETISLFMNADGVTHGTQSIWIIDFFTSIAGYLFSSFIAFFAFWLIQRKRFTVFIDILLGFILVNLLLWVRNPYGIFWLTSFGLIFLTLLINGSKKLMKNLCLLIASVLLVESTMTAFDILLISMIHPYEAGDAVNLANMTVIFPAQVWGVFFFSQALFFTVIGFKKGFYKVGESNIAANYQMKNTTEKF